MLSVRCASPTACVAVLRRPGDLLADRIGRGGELLGRGGDGLHVGRRLLGGRRRRGCLAAGLLGGRGEALGGRLDLACGRRDGVDDAGDVALEAARQIIETLRPLHLRLGLRLLLRGEAVGLDHVVLEDLHRCGHRADLVLAADADDLGRHLAPGEASHRLGHRRDRPGDAGHDQHPGAGAEQRRQHQGADDHPARRGIDLGAAVGRLTALGRVELEVVIERLGGGEEGLQRFSGEELGRRLVVVLARQGLHLLMDLEEFLPGFVEGVDEVALGARRHHRLVVGAQLLQLRQELAHLFFERVHVGVRRSQDVPRLARPEDLRCDLDLADHLDARQPVVADVGCGIVDRAEALDREGPEENGHQ